MFGWIDRAWRSVTGSVSSTVADWVHDVIHGLYWFLNIIFGNVGGAWSDLKNIFDFLGSKIEQYADDVWRAIYDAYKWINREGWLVYYYITHPAALVDLLWESLISKIEAQAWDTGKRLGEFFTSLILSHLQRFLTLIEDILNAIL